MKKLLSVLIAISLLVSLSACKKVDRTIANVDGVDVKTSVYKYFLNSEKSQFSVPEGTDADEYWNSEFVDGKSIKQYICDSALENTIRLIVAQQMAAEKGFKIDSEANREIDKQITSTKTQYGSGESFEQLLTSYDLTEDTFRALLESQYLEQKLAEAMQEEYSAEQMKDFYKNDMVNVQHILIMTVDQNRAPLPQQQLDEKKKQADDIYTQIKNGADFSELQAQFNEDSDGVEQTGYTLSKYSNYVEPFLSTALKLKADEVSEPVKSAYGYHIIKRFAHQDNDDMYVSAQTEILNGLFSKDVDDAMSKAKITYEQKAIDKADSEVFGG